MAKKGGGGSAERRQARIEGQVRYGPQTRLLRQMLADVRSQFTQGVAGEHSAYQALVDSAQQGRPQMSSIFHDAAHVAAGALTPAAGAPDFNAMGLGAGAAPFLAAASRDSSATQDRLAQTLQAANAELVQRQQDAASGQAYAIGKLASDASAQAGKIRQQQSGVSSDQGAFIAQRLGELLQATSDRNFKAGESAKARRNARVIAGVDKNGKPIPGGKADKKGASGLLPPKSNSDALAGIDRAEAQLRKRINLGSSPEAAAKVLKEGRDKVQGYPSRYTVNGKTYRVDPQTGAVMDGGKPLMYPGTTRIVQVDKATLPEIKAMNPLYVQAALDRVIYHGRYRAPTLRALRDAGIRVPGHSRRQPVSSGEVKGRQRKKKQTQTFAHIFGAQTSPNFDYGG